MLRIGFTCGVFDLLHAGHIYMLKECKQHCDFLIVAINEGRNFSSKINPGKKTPIYSFEHRVLLLENCSLVDKVVGYNSEEELMTLIKEHKATIRFLGDDYKGKPITGGELTKEIHYTDRSHGLSTSKYRKLIADMEKV